MTERDRMLLGELYDPFDVELVAARTRARDLCQDLKGDARFARIDATTYSARIVCPWGRHSVDAAAVLLRLRLQYRAGRAGVFQLQLCCARRLQRSHWQFYVVRPGSAGLHGNASDERTVAAFSGIRKTSGNRVRRVDRGRAIILPGVSIGSKAVIGAGSVVTRDIPERAFAAGNPCRAIRNITE